MRWRLSVLRIQATRCSAGSGLPSAPSSHASACWSDGQENGDARHGRIHGGSGVGVHLCQIDLAVKAFVDGVCQSDAQGIAGTFGGEIPDVDQANLGSLAGLKFDAAADDFRVQTRAADVLAQFFDDQKIELGEGNAAPPTAGRISDKLLPWPRCPQRLAARSCRDLMKFVFDHGHAGQNFAARQRLSPTSRE